MKPDKRGRGLPVEHSGVSKRRISREEMRQLLGQTDDTPAPPVATDNLEDTVQEGIPVQPSQVDVAPEPELEVEPEIEVTPQPEPEIEPEPELIEAEALPPDTLPEAPLTREPIQELLELVTIPANRKPFGVIIRQKIAPMTQAQAASQMGYKGRGIFNNLLNGERAWTEERLNGLIGLLKTDADSLLAEVRATMTL